MDLSALKSEDLPKRAMTFIEKEIGIYAGELLFIKHDVIPYISNPLIFEHRLYLQHYSNGLTIQLFVVNWMIKDSKCYEPTLDKMLVSDFKVFTSLAADLSAK